MWPALILACAWRLATAMPAASVLVGGVHTGFTTVWAMKCGNYSERALPCCLVRQA